ncbi:TonB-dependent receptor [Paludibaculum fermentans]|uniref:TonB-dependent receptor n=1 Tax=Paludibaculum fermentans TaxID=1473598 RepID=A0A7S7NLB6_PALFE|nr:carboxypeptidase-like regulatory domain-containing protein [Paludibaculum fermentans]QOY85742.1 TonB-dependent receptor [Paludibaculum fermentans]
MTIRHSWVWLTLLILAGTLCAVLPLSAQTTNAAIVGIVTDASGGAVPNATVTATNTGTGINRVVTTNDSGAFTLAPLIPGPYEVKVTNSGFKTKVQSNITLETGATLKLDIQLEVGQVSERIEVTAAAPMMQTQEASVASVVSTSQLERIPVNGRNFTRLIVMMPGTSDIAPNQSKGGQAGLTMVSVNGQRQQDSNYTIDGVDNNMMYMSSGVGAPPMDAIQEFRVATNNSAEYGRSAGANVNLSIKSGTRDLHGSVYEYFRNDKLDANDWFRNAQKQLDPATKATRVPFRQNQYGVAVGGPVVLPKVYNGRDKTFWFASWEGYRRRRGNTTISSTPIAAWRTGDFSSFNKQIYDPLTGTQTADGIVRQPFAGNIIPKARLNAGMLYLQDTYLPLPNVAGLQTNNYVMTDPTANNRDMLVLRGDHSLGSKDTFFARYMRQRVGENAPSNFSTVRYNGTRIDSDNFGVGWNHVFGTTTVLEVKYGYNHPNNPGCDQFKNGLKRSDVLAKAGIKMFDSNALCDVMPNFSADGLFGTFAGGGGETIIDTDHQYEAKLSRMMGRHSVKFGGQYMRRAMDAFFTNPTNGSANFWASMTNTAGDASAGNSYASTLLGYPNAIARGVGIPNAQGRQNSYSAFFQDDWRATDKLTINIGVRWEGFNRPYDAQDALGNLLVTRENGQDKAQLMWAGINPLPDPVTGVAGEGPHTFGYGRTLMKNRWMNFAPRVGIAYQANQKTVVRLAFGMFFNSTFMQELNDLRKFWPYLPQQVFSPNNTGAVPDTSISDAGPSFNSTQALGGWPQDPNNRTPYSQQWNIFVQRELMQDVTLDVGYVGSANRNQVGYVGWNNALKPVAAGVANPRRFAASGFTGNLDGGSNVFASEYNAMETKITKRFSKGLSILANYTWGKVMDDQSSLPEAKYQDMFNRRADWSPASYDLRHAFKVGYVYDLPFGKGRTFGASWNRFADSLLGGWALEGIVQVQTGRPLNVTSGQDTAHTGKYIGRADVSGNPILPMEQRSIDKWFNTSAFTMPVNAYGNSGANTVRADGKVVADVSVAKKFKFMERQSVEFRGEFYNLPNVINFGNPDTNRSSATFGKITSAGSARQVQFALRYAF